MNSDADFQAQARAIIRDEQLQGKPEEPSGEEFDILRAVDNQFQKANGVTIVLNPGEYSPVMDWRSKLICGKAAKDGNRFPKAILANAITAATEAPEWVGVLGFNEFTLSTVKLKSAPWPSSVVGTEWTDHEDRLLANWLQHQSIFVSVEVAGQAAQAVAKAQRFHPVREYLDKLSWDGKPRIDSWLTKYIGATPSNYSYAVAPRWLISAVARIYQPGCKSDSVLILEGAQGIKKSTALKTLADPWFTDEIADLGSKDAAMQTQGVWIIEISELQSMTQGEVGKIKAFVSRTSDRFRPPYGRRLVEAPRQCVFAGTVNDSAYLRDETGGRRFWPIACGLIDIKSLARDRDQLWAEARERFKGGACWWMETDYLVREAEKEQADRYKGDPWESVISDWIANRLQGGFDSVSTAEIFELCLEKKKSDWTRADQMRVGACLRVAKWERYRDRKRAMEWRYRPPVPTSGGNSSEEGNTQND